MTDLTPNIAIIKLNGSLVCFPLSEDGMVFDGEEFESDYVMENYHIILASYDVMTQESKELYRFSVLNEDKQEEDIKVLYQKGELPAFIKYLFKSKLGDE